MLVSLGWVTNAVRRQPGRRSYLYLSLLYPSVMIMVYAFGSGMMTALGRASFGIEQAYSSRYLFHSAALWVGFIAALNTHRILAARMRQEAGNFRGACLCVLAVFSILLVRTWNHFYKQFEPLRVARMQTLLNVRMLSLVPKSPMVEKTCPWLDLPALVKALAGKGIYDPSGYGDWLVEALKHPQAMVGGAAQIVPRPQQEIGITGWAINPERDRPADSVLLCRRGQAGNLEPFIMLAVGFKRNDIVRDTGKASLRKSGFMEAFRWPESDDIGSVEMFSVNERDRLLYPLRRIP